jgi:hypothetical protein
MGSLNAADTRGNEAERLSPELSSFVRVLLQVLLLRSCKLYLPYFTQNEHSVMVQYSSGSLTPQFTGLMSFHYLSLPNQKLT